MDLFDQKKCLESMIILVDTREQPSAKSIRRYKRFCCPFRRQKLDYGDYTYSFTLPDGTELIKESDVSPKPSVVIERKMGLEELSGNLAQQRKRFVAEMDRAHKEGASIYLLVEDASWDDVISGQYGTMFNPESFFHTLTAFSVRYGLKIIFCEHDHSGEIIKEILYRELKERLEAGYYD